MDPTSIIASVVALAGVCHDVCRLLRAIHRKEAGTPLDELTERCRDVLTVTEKLTHDLKYKLIELEPGGDPLHCHSRHQIPNKRALFPIACLMYNKTLGPLWHWLLLVSIQQPKQASRLSGTTMHAFPGLATLARDLHDAYALTFPILILSIGCTTLAPLSLFRGCNHKAKALVSILTCALLALVGSRWNSIGGSATEFFVVFVPLAISVGLSFGLPIDERIENWAGRRTMVVPWIR